jgi:hypothetical protein
MPDTWVTGQNGEISPFQDGTGNPVSVTTNAAGQIPTSAAAAAATFAEYPVSVTAGTTQLRPAKSGRQYLLVQNISTDTVFMTVVAGAAVVNTGQQLSPGGGSILFQAPAPVPQGAVYAIGATAGGTVLVTEG